MTPAPTPIPSALVVPRVVHVRSGQRYTLYIGRPMSSFGLEGSKWANPFRISARQDRSAVLLLFEEYLLANPNLLAALPELAGEVLGCWCAPQPCHGDVLVRHFEARVLRKAASCS